MHVPNLSDVIGPEEGGELESALTSVFIDSHSGDAFFKEHPRGIELDRLRDALYDIIRFDRCWGRP